MNNRPPPLTRRILSAYDDYSQRLIEIHGDVWDIFPESRGYWRTFEVFMRSVKTGHVKWWARDAVYPDWRMRCGHGGRWEERS